MRSGVRVSGGRHRGRPLRVPPGVRPSEGRVREALFCIWMEALSGSRFLDLFAGSGVVGLEAVSRGALAVVSVEAEPRVLREVARNVEALGERGTFELRRGELPGALSELRREGRRFDLLFADPPYAFPGYPELLAGMVGLLAPGGEIAVEHSARSRLPKEVAGLIQVDHRRYGESALSFYRPLEESQE